MALAHDTTDLQGRKQVRIRLRPNLVVTAQHDGSRTYHVIKDPVSLRYFRLEERQWFVVHLLDGTHTLEDIQRAYERTHRPDRLTLEELEGFAAQLVNGGLAFHESRVAGRLLIEQSNKQWWQALQAHLLSFLALKIPVCNPDRLLTRLLPWARFLFAPWFVTLAIGTMLAAVTVVITHWGDFFARLPNHREFFSLHNLLYLWLALGLVKVLHELGHGLCCKAFGGEVHEMGVMLLLGFPALYCNVTDSWQLPRRRQRMAVAASGIYVELLIAAVVTCLWWRTEQGTVLHHLCLSLMIVCSVQTIMFNANPLMQFDGYHILADWLNVPNLADLSGRQLLAGVLRWLGVNVPPEAPLTRCSPWLFAAYAVASHVYRCVVFATSFYLLYLFLRPYKLGSICVVLAAAAVAAVVVVVWAVPIPRKVQGLAIVQADPDQVDRVLVPDCGGFVRQLLVKDGQFVREGQILALLDNPKLDIALRLNEADQELRRQQQQTQVAHLTEAPATEAGVGGDLAQTSFELQLLFQQHALLKRQREKLILRAPRSGVVLGLEAREQAGKWLEQGAEFCRVGNRGALRATLLVESGDRQLVSPGAKVWLRQHGGGYTFVQGVVKEIARVEARNIPPQLSSQAGGDVATQTDPGTKQETPRNPHYLITVQLPRPDRAIHPGVLGRAEIEVEPQTLWQRCHSYLGTTLNWGL